MKTLGVVLALAALSLPCACSKNKPEAEATASPAASPARVTPIADPCKLLTQAEASEVAGVTLSPGETRRFGIITRCSFFDRSDPSRDVLLDVHNETAPIADTELFDSYTHMPDVQRVSGIGDQALWNHSEIGSGVQILKNGHLVEMKVPRSIVTMTPAVQKAAKAVASRM